MAQPQMKTNGTATANATASRRLVFSLLFAMLMMTLMGTVTEAAEGSTRGNEDRPLLNKNKKQFNSDVLGQAGFKKNANKQGRKSPSEKQRWREERKAGRKNKERGGAVGGDMDMDFGFGAGVGGGFAKKTPSEKAKWKEARKAARENRGNLSQSEKEVKRANRKLEREAQRAERERQRAERRDEEGVEL